MFLGVTNLMSDKEVTLLSSQCIFFGLLLMSINKLIKTRKKNHSTVGHTKNQ